MVVPPLQRHNVPDLPPERLAGNTTLTEDQKLAEVSRHFEAILLRQILSQTQKPVIRSSFSDNSTASSIYRDLVTSQLADSISKSGSFGIAQTFERQLSRACPERALDRARLEPRKAPVNSPSERGGAVAAETAAPHTSPPGPHEPPLSSLIP